MGNSTADCHQQAMMRAFAVVLLLFSSGVLADLECWEGGCGGPGEDPCTDSDPSLNKTICKAPVDMCAKAEGNINSASFKYWGCDMKENSETGCYDVTAWKWTGNIFRRRGLLLRHRPLQQRHQANLRSHLCCSHRHTFDLLI